MPGTRVSGCLLGVALAMSNIASAATVSIIVDDIGYDRVNSMRVAQLSPDITLSILPESPHAYEMAEFAEQLHRETMLHLPMQSTDPSAAAEGMTIREDMDESEVKSITAHFLNSFPNVKGVNNHQGSLLTQDTTQMSWVLDVIQEQSTPLYFIDSRTHENSTAAQVCHTKSIACGERDFFLDAGGDNAKATGQQLQRIQNALQTHEYLTIIAHPYDTSIPALQALLTYMRTHNHQLVRTSELVRLEAGELLPENQRYRLVQNRHAPSVAR